MKSHFSRVVALGVLVCVSASSRAQAPSAVKPKMRSVYPDPDNQFSLSMIGSFFDKMRRAKSYRGHLTALTTTLKAGKVVSKRITEIQSAWIRSGFYEGEISKGSFDFVSTFTSGKTTETNEFSSVNDGNKSYFFSKTQGIWCERERYSDDNRYMVTFTESAWIHALQAFGDGEIFNIKRNGEVWWHERENIAGNDEFSLSSRALEYIFNAKNGGLKSFTQKSVDRKIEFRWSDTEFDVPLPASTFVWKVPESAKKVDRGSVGAELVF